MLACGAPFKPKVMVGDKAGSALKLIGPAAPRFLALGEGIETALSLFTVMARAGRVTPDMAFWAAGDLGNMAGRAADRIPHPHLRDAQGRVRMIPGHEPDRASPAAPIPDSVTDLVLIGDGDSDAAATRAALARAAHRHARDGRTIRILMAPQGGDLNDWLTGKLGEMAEGAAA